MRLRQAGAALTPARAVPATTTRGIVFVLASVLLLAFLSARPAAGAVLANSSSTTTCPGLMYGTCTLDCQLHECDALLTFYATSQPRAPYGAGGQGAWNPEFSEGWRDAAAVGCRAYVGAGASPPRYCNGSTAAAGGGWFGVSCAASGTVAGIVMPGTSYVNASLNDARFFAAIAALDACGLRTLNLESAKLNGSFTPAWGRLKSLADVLLSNK